jgi:hypothetical protein
MNGETSPRLGSLGRTKLLTSSPPILANGASYTGAGIGGLLGIALVRVLLRNPDGLQCPASFHDLNAQQQKIQVLSRRSI